MSTSSTSKPADAIQKETPILFQIGADDEFEEFENDWTPAEEEEEDKHHWEEDWDDEELDDDFSKQLRAELEKIGSAPATSTN